MAIIKGINFGKSQSRTYCVFDKTTHKIYRRRFSSCQKKLGFGAAPFLAWLEISGPMSRGRVWGSGKRTGLQVIG